MNTYAGWVARRAGVGEAGREKADVQEVRAESVWYEPSCRGVAGSRSAVPGCGAGRRGPRVGEPGARRSFSSLTCSPPSATSQFSTWFSSFNYKLLWLKTFPKGPPQRSRCQDSRFPLQEAQVQSLVGELRSCMPCGRGQKITQQTNKPFPKTANFQCQHKHCRKSEVTICQVS